MHIFRYFRTGVSFDSIHSQYEFLFHLSLSDESIEVRYHLLEYIRQHYGCTVYLEKDISGKPLPINLQDISLFWSISHSQHYGAFILSDRDTGIDIVEYRERDPSLLRVHTDSEYDVLGGKNWKNFYILWTAKESLIKAVGKSLDDMSEIVLREKVSAGVSIFGFRKKTYKIETLIHDDCILSYFVT